MAGITTLDAANRYLAECFVPQHNATFARAPRDPASAFVPLGAVDLDVILCHEEERVVARDNTVTLGGRVLQIAPQPGRRSCVGLTVTVRQHLDGRHTITRGTQWLAPFATMGGLWTLPQPWTPRTRPPLLGKRPERVCVQRRLARSVGDKPTEATVSRLVALVAGRKEIEFLKPTNKAIHGMVSESSGRNERERNVTSKWRRPRGRAYMRWVKAA